MEKKKVIVGMSGGVDSSVAAYLLKEQGYEVIGVTMEMWKEQEDGPSGAEDAARVAQKLGIPFYHVDFRKEFKENVADYFMDSYERGLTPNPCIVCNRKVKWEALLAYADRLGAEYIATGHYANIKQYPETGRYSICAAAAEAKDQTYALYRLTQEQLSRTLMPVGQYEKTEIRKIAEGIDDFVAKKNDSQDICFIPDGDYAAFLLRQRGTAPEPGNFVDLSGRVLGQHKGLLYYTVGQRKGLGIAFGQPMYVYGLRPEKNEVVLCDNAALFTRTVTVREINAMAVERFQPGMRFQGKIRYSHKMAWCTISRAEGDEMECVFDEPQRAVTPGQALVLYDGGFVVGGGTIIHPALSAYQRES